MAKPSACAGVAAIALLSYAPANLESVAALAVALDPETTIGIPTMRATATVTIPPTSVAPPTFSSSNDAAGFRYKKLPVATEPSPREAPSPMTAHPAARVGLGAGALDVAWLGVAWLGVAGGSACAVPTSSVATTKESIPQLARAN